MKPNWLVEKIMEDLHKIFSAPPVDKKAPRSDAKQKLGEGNSGDFCVTDDPIPIRRGDK